MAIGAYPRRHGVLSDQCEARVVVIKRRIRPINRVVTRFARRGEAGRPVRRVGRPSVILLMARIAQRAVQGIVVIDVAIGTGPRRHRVRVGQREAGTVVVKRTIGPLRGVVAGLAGRR